MYIQDEDGASEAKKNSASFWTLPSRKTNKSSSIFWWLAKVLSGSLCPRPTEDRWLQFCFMNSWSSLTLYSPALRLLLDMETNHYCIDQKHMDTLSLLKLDCMQSWVQWGVVKELAMVETRKAESRMGSRWEALMEGKEAQRSAREWRAWQADSSLTWQFPQQSGQHKAELLNQQAKASNCYCKSSFFSADLWAK